MSPGGTLLGYVIDTILERKIPRVAKVVQNIRFLSDIRFYANARRCEIICNNFNFIDQYPIFKDLIRVATEELAILGHPLFEGKVIDKALIAKITDLKRSVERLSLLPTHNEVCLLKMNLQYQNYDIVTSPCSGRRIFHITWNGWRHSIISRCFQYRCREENI